MRSLLGCWYRLSHLPLGSCAAELALDLEVDALQPWIIGPNRGLLHRGRAVMIYLQRHKQQDLQTQSKIQLVHFSCHAALKETN